MSMQSQASKPCSAPCWGIDVDPFDTMPGFVIWFPLLIGALLALPLVCIIWTSDDE